MEVRAVHEPVPTVGRGTTHDEIFAREQELSEAWRASPAVQQTPDCSQ